MQSYGMAHKKQQCECWLRNKVDNVFFVFFIMLEKKTMSRV